MSAVFDQDHLPGPNIKHDVVSISAPLVNIEFDIGNRDDLYAQACLLLGTGPGLWAPIDSIATLGKACELLSREAISLHDIGSGQLDATITITAGSTGLDTLAALRPEQRENSAIVSTTALDASGREGSLSRVFSQAVDQLGLTHYKTPVSGANPSVIILSSQEHPEKAMATYPGIGHELNTLPSGLDARILHVDAYELRRGPIAKLIDQVIDSRQFNVALGLGSTSILEGSLRNKILRYVREGKIHVLLGNGGEFQALLDTQEDVDETTVQSLKLHSLVPNILITLGAQGMCVFRDGAYLHQPAYPVTDMISTAGAGDTAAGVFISGILDNKPLRAMMEEAAFYASQVLVFRGSRLPDGRV